MENIDRDAIIFAVSQREQLYNTLDAIVARPLPTDLADAINVVCVTVEDSEPVYHL